MKKLTLIMVFALSLLVCVPFAVMAEVGFHIGLGYNQLSNELTIGVPSHDLVEINTPVKMFTLDLGYNFSERLAVDAQYSWGTTDLVGICNDEVTIDQDNTIWRVEGSYKWPVSKKVKLGAVLGYADYDTTTALSCDDDSIGLGQNFSGAYIGPVLTYNPNDKFEFGIAYRWMINPDGELEATIDDHPICSTELEDLEQLFAGNLCQSCHQ